MKNIVLIMTAIVLFACKTDKKSQTSQNNNASADSVKTDTLDDLAKAQLIHKNVITLDTHCDINVANFTPGKNYTQRLETQVNLPKMEEGGLNVAWFIVYTGQGPLNNAGYKKAYANAMSKFEAIHRLCEEIAPDKINLALTSADVRRIHAEGKKVAMIGVENGYPIGTDIGNVKKFYDLGARYMSLAHNGHSQLSDSNTGEENDQWLHNGLSELGKQVIDEMNKWGMMIDLSHPSKEANIEMIKRSKAPVIASHSSARALCDHSRNLDDEVLKMVKDNGGVVHAVAFTSYVNKEKDDKYADFERNIFKQVFDSLGVKWMPRHELRQLSNEEREQYYDHYIEAKPIVNKKIALMDDAPEQVSVADFVDHIDYMVDLIGIDHVGISSDFDGGGGIEGWQDASETFNVTLELVKRGYTEEEIGKLWSGNLLRVLDEVQKVAEEIQAGS